MATTAVALAGSNGSTGAAGDSGGGLEVAGRPKMQKAFISVHSTQAGQGRHEPGGSEGDDRLPVQPQGSHDRQVGQVGAQAGQGRRRVHRRPSSPVPIRASSPSRCSSTPPGPRTARCWRSSRSCSPAASRPRRAPGRRSRPRRWSCCTGAAISSFPAFVTSVSAKYTLFSSDGTPIRAVCSVSMEEMPASSGRQNPTSGSDDVRRVHRTVAGDTPRLDRVRRVRRPRPLAPAGRVQRHRRPAAAAHRPDDPAALARGAGG